MNNSDLNLIEIRKAESAAMILRVCLGVVFIARALLKPFVAQALLGDGSLASGTGWS